jgi:hypothetical protein
MSEFNEHKLFELSKKAAEDFYDSSLIPSWDKMEKQLDYELPVKKKRGRAIVFWMLFSVFIGGMAYLSSDEWYRVKPTNRKETQLSLPVKKTDKINQSSSQESDVANNNPTPLNIIIQLKQENNSKGNPLTYEYGSTKGMVLEKPNNIDIRKPSIEKKEAQPSHNLNASEISIGNKSVFPVETNNLLVNSANDTTRQNTVVYKEIDFNSEAIVSNQNNIINNSFVATPAGVDSASIRLSVSGSRKQIKSNSRFSIAAIAGTNFNNVKFNPTSRQGLDYGLLLGYRITPKIELRGGLLMAKKYFNANGKVISFDSAKLNLPSYSSINLEDANGYCRFIEIPVMFLYHFSPQNRTGLYAGAGFSINKMRRENIDYTFLIDASTVVERTHAGIYHNMNNSFTSLTSNFSFGIKRRLSQNWSIAAEPYIKLPLTKINDSNLKLTTFGATLIFTFHPALRNRNK